MRGLMSRADEFVDGDIVVSLYRNRGFWKITGRQIKQYHQVTYTNFEVEFVMTLEGVAPKKKAKKGILPEQWATKVSEEFIATSRQRDINKWDKLLQLVKVKTPEEIEQENIEQGKDPEILTYLGPPDTLKVSNI